MDELGRLAWEDLLLACLGRFAQENPLVEADISEFAWESSKSILRFALSQSITKIGFSDFILLCIRKHKKICNFKFDVQGIALKDGVAQISNLKDIYKSFSLKWFLEDCSYNSTDKSAIGIW